MTLRTLGTNVAALNNAYAGRWQPNTAYNVGDVVVAPDGSTVKRLTSGTSGSSYTSANWQTVATVAGTQAQSELAAAFTSAVSTPAKVQQGIDESGATTSRTAGLTNTPTQGNLLVAMCMIRSGNTAAQITGPAGYTLVSMTATSANNARIGVWAKTAGASESKTANVTAAVSTGMYLVLTEWAGVTSTVDVIHTGNTGGSTATSRTLGPASTTTQPNGLALAYIGSNSTLGTLGSWTGGFAQEGTTTYPFASAIITSQTEPATSMSWATARIVNAVLVTFKAKTSVTYTPAATTRPVRSKFDPIAEFGAVGDSVTDDTTAVQNALAAAQAVGGEVYFSKLCRTSAPLVMGVGPLTISGASRKCGITNAASNLFSWSGAEVRVSSVLLRSEPGGGHIFDQVGDTTNCNFFDVEADQQNTGSSVYRHINDLGNYLFNNWFGCKINHTRSGTVPTMHFKPLTSAGATNSNLFQRIEMLNSSGVYGFHLESARDSNYIYGMTLRDISWEVPSGGCVKVLGGNGIVLEEQDIYDLNIQQAANHLFYAGVGTGSPGASLTRNLRISGVKHNGTGAELAAGKQHIFFESNNVPFARVENVRQNSTGAMLVDYGSNTVLEIACPTMTRLNASKLTRVDSAGLGLSSPDGTQYRLAVANGGTVSVTAG